MKKIKSIVKEFIPIDVLRYYRHNIRKRLDNRIPRDALQFEIHLVEHCNLNCKGCDNFSPLAEKNFKDLMSFENDFKRLSELFERKMDRILLLGGEPLLHPRLSEFFQIARRYFPEGKIILVTNGILLPLQKLTFWENVKQYNIIISITKYPIKIDYKNIEKKAMESNVQIEYFNGQGEKSKFHKIPIDLTGKQNIEYNFEYCYKANNCISLKNGKMYTCTTAANIHHFNSYYNENIPITSLDYIDIYEAKTGKEILNFLSRPIPLCKYCKIEAKSSNLEWSVSEKDKSEWI